MIPSIAGVVVLYNPAADVVDKIRTYSASLGKLYLIDNSENPSIWVAEAVTVEAINHEYIAYHQNLGIAKALNDAASKALQEGYEWLLTMDQDSKASEGMVEGLFEATKELEQTTMGIIAPQYIEASVTSASRLPVEEVMTTITSGNLLNLKAYAAIGTFREDLFIDFVDIDYCLRLYLGGYKVWIINQLKLNHQLGNASCHSFMGRKLWTSNHNYIRRYYITRNRLAILNEYKKSCPAYYQSEKNKNFIEITKLLLFEKDRMKKLKSIVQGYIDYKRHRFGKYA
ncbi:hypothetical protein [Pontibacter chitinilyticus]|uniref:hypothetical protein n=1 Tax=Pontibacter chitinilyticus TaxID=2674989 RepID=UPI00321C0CC4